MRELAQDGMTMLLVTHELPFAQEVSGLGRLIDPSEERTKAYVTTYSAHFAGGLEEAQRVMGL